MSSKIDNIKTIAVLDGWDSYRRQAAASNRVNRVKIERGHSWLVRFLPFEMSASGFPFAWLAQHWVAGKPIYCKQHTDKAFGGDPNYLCPVCDVTAACHAEAEDEGDRDDFFRCFAREFALMYNLVFAKEDDRGRSEQVPEDEVLVPYEFSVPKSSFANLHAKVERSKQRKGASPIGLFDLETGSDLWAVRDKKNSLTFETSEDGPGPVFTLDEQFDAKIQRVWRQLKQPSPKFLSDDRLNAVADKLAERMFEKAGEAAFGDNDGRGARRGFSGGGGSDSRGRGRGRNLEEEETEDRPRASRRVEEAAEEAPVRRPTTRVARQAPAPVEAAEEQAPEEAPIEEQPTAPAPVRTVRPRAAAPVEAAEPPPPTVRRSVGAPARPSAAVAAARRAEAPAPVEAAEEQAPEEAPIEEQPTAPAPVRRSAPAAVTAATPAPARRSTATVAAAEEDDSPEALPEETSDPAPAAETEGMGEQPEPAPAPVRQAARTAAPQVSRSALAQSLSRRINTLATKSNG